MGVYVGLINLGELATHVSLHEDSGLGVVIKTDEVHADVNPANSAEGVVETFNKVLLDLRGVLKITCTVVET